MIKIYFDCRCTVTMMHRWMGCHMNYQMCRGGPPYGVVEVRMEVRPCQKSVRGR
jgi:hypothetical protein